MKLHWGIGLGIGFAFFALGILALVIISMNQKIDLVSDDYYQKELRHQEQIERTQRSTALKERLEVTSVGTRISIRFPKMFSPGNLKGTLSFYRPADRSNDFSISISLDSTNAQSVITDSLVKGLWRLKAFWTSAQLEYYHEEALIIQ
ncbi:MAG: FixH family protein [bacterium]